MKIAYFINQYPKVSHSFIRREINAVENQGVDIVRYALRTDVSELVDDYDISEQKKTTYLLEQSPFDFIAAFFFNLLSKPLPTVVTIVKTIKIGIKSDRGLVRHVIYFFEACILKRMLLSDRIDHVHAHFGTNSATVVMLAHFLGGPKYSFTVHGPEEFDKPEFISLGKKIKNAEFVVAISSFGRSQLFRQVDHVYWDKVKVVHCGLDKSFYSVNIPPVKQNKRLVCVGRLCEQKGQLLLVEAAIKLSEEGEDFQLVLAGDGPMRKDIESLIEKYNLSSKIEITGWISSEQVRDEILNSSFLILPSFAEGLPVVIMETMALERPVLTTYIAGIPELVIPGENGWLIPAGSLESLVISMRKALCESDTELQRLGKNAHKSVIQMHDIDIEATKLVKLFNNE